MFVRVESVWCDTISTLFCLNSTKLTNDNVTH